jgi:glycosyltransferase involved in cell wall biosynthesis
MKLFIYISNYNNIGGVERFVENFCKRMSKHYDITLLFDYCQDYDMLFEMAEFVNIAKLDKVKGHKCDIFVNSTAWGTEPYNYINSKRCIQIIHADYRHVIANWNFKYIRHKKTTHHVAVGELVKTSFEIATPYKIDKIIYNLLDNTYIPKPKKKNKVLSLITVSRLSGEKGFDRMLKLAQLLDKEKIDYIWDIYGSYETDWQKKIKANFKDCKNVFFKGVVKRPFEQINQADYLVQLSDTEGFAYSVYEALQVKTPCLITPFASGKEQITDGENGYILPFDMKGIDLNKILNKIPKFTEFNEIGSEQSWIDFFNEIK